MFYVLGMLQHMEHYVALPHLTAWKLRFVSFSFVAWFPIFYSFTYLVVWSFLGFQYIFLFLVLQAQQTIIDNNGNNNGWKILGLAPQLRKCIHEFYERDYSQGLQTLDKLKSNFLLDLYLSCHVETLYTLIRQKALMEYVRPFSCLEMKTMAAAFNTTVDELEEELDALITDNKLQVTCVARLSLLISKPQRINPFFYLGQAQIVSHNTAC